MIKSLATISILATAAWAQNSTSSPLIPTGISSGCSSYLNTLNNDATLASCVAPLVSASQAYGPGGNASTAASASAISSALNNLCSSASTACPESSIRKYLADFYAACSAELTSNPNTNVITTYDVLYTLSPLKTAVCSKDDSGRYCVTNIGDTITNSSSAASHTNGLSNALVAGSVLPLSITEIQKHLASAPTVARRSEAALVPNTTTFGNTNLVFLFLQPTLSSDLLCTTCTRSVLTSYINFESNTPYAPGLSASPLLKGQSALYSAVQNTCGSSFLSGAVQAAGGLSGGILGSGASRSISGDFKGTVGALLGGVGLAIVAIL